MSSLYLRQSLTPNYKFELILTMNKKELDRKIIRKYPAADLNGQLYWVVEYMRIIA